MAEEEEKAEEPKAGLDPKKKKLIIIGGAAALVVIIIAVLAIFLLGGEEEEVEEEPVKKEVVIEDLEPVEIPVFFQLGSYSVMLADGKYNLRVGLQLLMSNEPAKFYLNARMPLIKDALNDFLPGLTGEKLHSEEGRDEMRKAVIKKIHEVFPEEEVPGGDPWPIRELLFDEFVLTLAYYTSLLLIRIRIRGHFKI